MLDKRMESHLRLFLITLEVPMFKLFCYFSIANSSVSIKHKRFEVQHLGYPKFSASYNKRFAL